MEKRLPLNPFVLSDALEIDDEMGETGEKSNQSSSESEIKSPVIAEKYRKLCHRSELDEFKFYSPFFMNLLSSILSFTFSFAGINSKNPLCNTLHCSFNKQAQTALFDSVEPSNPSDQNRLG